MSPISAEDRRRLIVQWQGEQSLINRIDDRDALLYAALGPLSDVGVQQVLWNDPDAFQLRWSVLRDLFTADPTSGTVTEALAPPHATPEPTPITQADPEPEPVAPVPEQHQPEPEPQPVTPVDPGQLRTERVLAWHAEGAGSRPEVAALDAKHLAKLGHARAETPDAVQAYLTATRGGAVDDALVLEITGVLRGESLDAVDDAPVGVPAAMPVVEAPARRDFMADPGQFAPFDWDNFAEVDPAAVAPLSVNAVEDSYMLRWDDADSGAGHTLYRVLSAPDGWALMSPDLAQLVGVTDQTVAATSLYPTSAVTYLSVFVNSGPDETTARAAQPSVHAKGQIIWPPTQFRVDVDAVGRVVGKFTAPPGAHVEVQRRLATDFPGYNPARRLSANATVASTGFVDGAPPLAQDVVYAVYTSTTLPTGETVSSLPVEQTIRVTPPPAPPQLQVTRSDTGFYDLSWTAPQFGTVEIFMLGESLPPGFADEVRTRGQLEGEKLTSEAMLLYPVLSEGDRQVMRGCSSNPDWVQTHFFAAHVVDEDHIGIGAAVKQVVVPAPTHMELIERVDSEIITFAWPKGVGLLEVYRGPRGSDGLDLTVNEPMMSLTEDAYFRMGGMHLTDTLPPNGCSLHLYGVVYTPEALRSDPVTIDYPGIVRVRYRLVWVGANGAQVTRPEAVGLRVEIHSDETLQGVQMSLVSHPNRLPLHPQEVGGSLIAAEMVSVNAYSTGVAFSLPVTAVTGWVRLFVTNIEQAGQYAILDPPVDSLNLTVGGPS